MFLVTGVWGPHLIVVRTCKLLNWEVEFKRWCPGLKILLYLGNRRERRSKRMVALTLSIKCLIIVDFLLICFMADINYFIWWLIHSGGGKQTASMYVWHRTSCWWRTRATSWGEGGGTWSWMRCSSSKTWRRNTGKPSLLLKGELAHLYFLSTLLKKISVVISQACKYNLH